MGVGEITAISTVTSLSSSFSSLSPAMRKQPEGVFITTSHTPSSLSPSSPSPSPSPSPFPSPFPSSSPSPSPSPSSLSPTLLFIPFSRKNIAYEIPLSSSLLQLPSSSVEKSGSIFLKKSFESLLLLCFFLLFFEFSYFRCREI